ncbi:MAG: hypothetical protein Q9182_004202 [Xanthomendoza sp. 2 TL-2023]
MATVIQRHPKGFLGFTAASLSASISYAVYNYSGTQVDPEVLVHVENLIAEIPIPTLPLEDVIPASFSSAVRYYTPTFVKNILSSDFLASHDWSLYALTGVIVWATVSDTLLAVAYKSRDAAKHRREEEIARERHLFKVVIEARDKEISRLQDSVDAAKKMIDAQADMISLNKAQKAENDKLKQILQDKLDASQAKRQEDEETIKTLLKDLNVADTRSQDNALTIAQQSTTITHLEEKTMGLEQTHRALTDRICLLEADIIQKDGTITILTERNEEMTNSSKVADTKSQDNALTIAQQSTTITHLEEKTKGLERTHRALTDRICALEADIIQKDGTITILTERNEEMTKSSNDLTDRLGSVSTLNARQHEIIAACQHDNEEIKKSVAGLEAQVKSLTRDNSQQANTITQSNRRNQELERTVTDLRSEGSTLKAQKSSLECSAQADKNTITQHGAKIVELERKGGHDKCTTQKLKEQIRTLEDAKNVMEGSLSTANARCTSLTGDLRKVNAAKTKDDYESLDKQYRVLQADREQDATKYKSTTDCLQRRINDLEGAVRTKDETTAAQTTTILGLKCDLESRTRTIGDLQGENEVLKKNLDQISSTVDDLHFGNASLQSKFENCSTAIDDSLNLITIFHDELTTANTTRDSLAARNTLVKADQRGADAGGFGHTEASLRANATGSLWAELEREDREIEASEESKYALQAEFTRKTIEFKALRHSETRLPTTVRELVRRMEGVDSLAKSQQVVLAEGSQPDVPGKLSRKAKQQQHVRTSQDAKASGSARPLSSSMESNRADQYKGVGPKGFGHPPQDQVKEDFGQSDSQDEAESLVSSTHSLEPTTPSRRKLRARAYKKKKNAEKKAVRINANAQSSSLQSNEQSSHDCQSEAISSQDQRDGGSETADGGEAQGTSRPDKTSIT